MKTTYTPDTIVLVGGEIYALSDYIHTKKDDYFIFFGQSETSVHKYHSDIGYGLKTFTEFDKNDESSLILSRTRCSYKIDYSTTKLDGVTQLDRQQFVRAVDSYTVRWGDSFSDNELLKIEAFSLAKRLFADGYNEICITKEFTLSIPQSVTIENGVVTEITW